MRWLLLVAASVAAMLATASCGSAATTYRTCVDHLSGSRTGLLQAGAGTTCSQAKTVYKRLTIVAQATGAAYEGKVDTWRCDFNRTGHVVYVCRDGSLRMRVWAGARTS